MKRGVVEIEYKIACLECGQQLVTVLLQRDVRQPIMLGPGITLDQVIHHECFPEREFRCTRIHFTLGPYDIALYYVKVMGN